ncbi:MAG: GNAT family N-acetyltransferase [Bacteroidales bacterium]|nr:GNAT family N-acetyltransferase [Bacteroidales bacterium]
MGITYILENYKHTIAFCTILNDKISMSSNEKNIWNKINRNIPNNKRRKSYPAIKIGSLATNTIYQRQGYGAALIDFVKDYLLSNKQFSGCRFITVDASNNEKTISFYKNYGFKFLSDKDNDHKTRCMYHDIMKTE